MPLEQNGDDPVAALRVETDFAQTYPEASALATECMLNVARLAVRCRGHVEALVRRHGLPSMAAFNALEVVRGANEPLPPSIIAERMVVGRGTVTAIVDTLDRRGLIRRHPHETDRRMRLVAVTAEGSARARAVLPELHQMERHWVRALDIGEQRELLRLVALFQSGVGPPHVERR